VTRTALSALLVVVVCGPWLGLGATAAAQDANDDPGRFRQKAPPDEWTGPKPTATFPEPRGALHRGLDVAAYAVALALGTWIILKWRSRRALIALMVASLAYFGLYRSGCVCPVGAIQNVTLSLADPTYTISVAVTALFLMPIALALFAGRVFCGGVCPFGALQDLLLRVKLHVPMWIERPLRYLRWVYLAVAIYFVVGGLAIWGLDLTVKPDFLICKYDPFVSMFRSVDVNAALAGEWSAVYAPTGPAWMWYVTGGLLLTAVFVGRPYCRWLCPYGAILGTCSRTVKRGVTVMPEACCDCGLCEKACALGAIKDHAAVNGICLACARCFAACPLERQRLGLPVTEVPLPAAVPVEVPPPAPKRSPVPLRRIVGEEEELDLTYLDTLIAQVGRGAEAALPLLQAVQGRHKYLPRPALGRLCELTDVSMAQLMGMSTFYNQFRLAPIGEHLVCICHGTACHVAGARRINDAVRLHLGIIGDADTDGARQFTIQEVACLGCCSLAPVMQIDGVTFGHLTAETAQKALDSARAGKVHLERDDEDFHKHPEAVGDAVGAGSEGAAP